MSFATKAVRPESSCLQWGNGHDARYPDCPNRRAVSRWGVAGRGWSRLVKELPLKGTGEAEYSGQDARLG